MATHKELAQLIGREVVIRHGELPIRVIVEDARVSFGRTDVLVRNADPEVPRDTLWIDAERLRNV
jgi:hypothetical protein